MLVDSEMEARIAELARLIERSSHAVALTGAGVSTESGIPDFRSEGGLWGEVDPAAVASIQGFLADPEGFYRFWGGKLGMLRTAEPNLTHRVLSELERRGRLATVITQNIDGLHGRAGSERVLEVHGTFERARCIGCSTLASMDGVFEEATRRVPRCGVCGDLLKPDVVLFGEMLPPAFEEAEREVDRADLLLVLGCSLEVHPAADLVPQAKERGARTVLLNREVGLHGELFDLVIRGELSATMRSLAGIMALPVLAAGAF